MAVSQGFVQSLFGRYGHIVFRGRHSKAGGLLDRHERTCATHGPLPAIGIGKSLNACLGHMVQLVKGPVRTHRRKPPRTIDHCVQPCIRSSYFSLNDRQKPLFAFAKLCCAAMQWISIRSMQLCPIGWRVIPPSSVRQVLIGINFTNPLALADIRRNDERVVAFLQEARGARCAPSFAPQLAR